MDELGGCEEWCDESGEVVVRVGDGCGAGRRVLAQAEELAFIRGRNRGREWRRGDFSRRRRGEREEIVGRRCCRRSWRRRWWRWVDAIYDIRCPFGKE